MTATLTARRAAVAALLAVVVLATADSCKVPFPSGPRHWERTPASVATPR
jgi:hypothetical protein